MRGEDRVCLGGDDGRCIIGVGDSVYWLLRWENIGKGHTMTCNKA